MCFDNAFFVTSHICERNLTLSVSLANVELDFWTSENAIHDLILLTGLFYCHNTTPYNPLIKKAGSLFRFSHENKLRLNFVAKKGI